MKKNDFVTSLNIRVRKNLKSFSVNNALYALIGFMSFLSIIISAKIFEYIFMQRELISIDTVDILLSVLGSILIFLYKGFEHKFNK
jgi:hypothetical protein